MMDWAKMNRKKIFKEITEKMQDLFGNKLRKVILYGSYARREQDNESDIDFFVLVEDSEESLSQKKYKIAEIMTELSLSHNVLVSITEETLSRYNKYSDILPFYRNVNNEGVEIYGR